MNLIEQLGGYEEAKMLRGTTSNALLDMKTWTVHVDDIDSALLEHRRANNIFEVGDFVVLKSQPHLYAFVREYSYQKKNLLVKRANIINISIVKIRAEISKNISEIYHATDAEIEAGRRL